MRPLRWWCRRARINVDGCCVKRSRSKWHVSTRTIRFRRHNSISRVLVSYERILLTRSVLRAPFALAMLSMKTRFPQHTWKTNSNDIESTGVDNLMDYITRDVHRTRAYVHFLKWLECGNVYGKGEVFDLHDTSSFIEVF